MLSLKHTTFLVHQPSHGSLTVRQHLSWSGFSFGDFIQTFVINGSEHSFASSPSERDCYDCPCTVIPGLGNTGKHSHDYRSFHSCPFDVSEAIYVHKQEVENHGKDKCIILPSAHHHHHCRHQQQ